MNAYANRRFAHKKPVYIKFRLQITAPKIRNFASSNCQAKCNSLVEKVNRRNKANTLIKMQKLKILDAATPRIFKITQKLKQISYFCCELCGFVCQILFADIGKISVQ